MLLGTALSGCNESAPVLHFSRETFRTDSIATCSSGMQMGGAPGAVADRICGCGIDRFMAGKSDAQIDAMSEEEQRQGSRTAVQYCLAHEHDFGPVPAAPPSSAPSPSGQGDSPSPTGDPGTGPGAVAGNAEGSVEQARRQAEEARRATETAAAEARSAAENEAAASRWRQTPPR
ncbi:MAG TPA: hypothetical protein VIT38_11810 [Allosphingosinicella sp.]